VVQTASRQRAEADEAAYAALFSAMQAHRDSGRRVRRTRRPAGTAVVVRGLVALSLALLGGCWSTGDPARDPCRHVSGHGPLPCQTSTSTGVPR
jgi:hypothetical protein